MSKESVQKVIDVIADKLLDVATAVLENDDVGTNVKIGKNTLKNSVLNRTLSLWHTLEGDPVMSALFNHYVVYLEWTRPPKYGKKPPIGVLKEWAARNGIPTDADTLWAISYAIWRDGHAGRPIFATMDAELDGLFMNDWSDKLFTAITDDLDKFFNAA